MTFQILSCIIEDKEGISDPHYGLLRLYHLFILFLFYMTCEFNIVAFYLSIYLYMGVHEQIPILGNRYIRNSLLGRRFSWFIFLLFPFLVCSYFFSYKFLFKICNILHEYIIILYTNTVKKWIKCIVALLCQLMFDFDR